MGMMATLKGNQAYSQHAKGNLSQARKLYEEAYEGGLDKAKTLLGYAILLIRENDFPKAAEVLRRTEKAADLTPDMRTQMLVHYAIAMWKLDNIDRALEILWDVYRKQPTAYIYSTLGFLLVEKGDADEALKFNQEAYEYDDEDAIFLDNLAQTYYRLLHDKETAKPLFEKAVYIKPTAIDSNYFLAQYDLEAGDKAAALEKLSISAAGQFSPLNYVEKDLVDTEIARLQTEA